jgi:hypothetical protein
LTIKKFKPHYALLYFPDSYPVSVDLLEMVDRADTEGVAGFAVAFFHNRLLVYPIVEEAVHFNNSNQMEIVCRVPHYPIG